MEHTSTSADWVCPHARRGEGSESGTGHIGGPCTRTAWNDRLEVDDRVGERSAMECLAGYFEGGEEEGRCHFHFFRGVVRRPMPVIEAIR